MRMRSFPGAVRHRAERGRRLCVHACWVFDANGLPIRVAMAFAALSEVGSAIAAHNNLVLTTLQLIQPIPAVAVWQDEINPPHPSAP